MSDFIKTDIRFNATADNITSDELSLIESILSEIILAMMQAEAQHDDD